LTLIIVGGILMLFWLATGPLQLEIYIVRHRDMLPAFDVGDTAIM